MATEQVIEVINQQTWLDPVSDVLQKAVENAYAAGGATGQRVKNLVSGTWLGHPLHPAVTDVPVGSWCASLIFDIMEVSTNNPACAMAADTSQNIGLAAAVVAAISGLSDWHFTIERPRRLGVAHGLLNLTAASLYGTSSVLRLTGARPWGRRVSFLGFGIALCSAWLGGDLAYHEHLGMDRSPEEAPADFVAVLDDTALADGQLRRVEADGIPVLLVRDKGSVYALGEVCSHLGGPLSEGTCVNGVVTCPWHSSQFALRDGHVINSPATFSQPVYQTRVRNGKIEVGPRMAKTLAGTTAAPEGCTPSAATA